MKNNILLSNYATFSFVEMMTLQLLMQHSKPIVRHALYLEVNNFIQSEDSSIFFGDSEAISGTEQIFYENISENKAISTSSFYHSLDNFEKKGLIECIKDEKSGKINSIKATPLAGAALLAIQKRLFRLGIMSLSEIAQNLFKIIIKHIKIKSFDTMLSVIDVEYTPLNFVQGFDKFVKELFILTSPNTIEIIDKMKLDFIKYSNIYKKIIREPDNHFDGAIIPFYLKNPTSFEMTGMEYLKELVRVVKPEGHIIITALSKYKITDNLFAKTMIKMFYSSFERVTYDKKQIIEDLNKANLKEIEVFEHQGILVGVGIVP